METRRRRLWHMAREYVTHWSVAGIILAATGAAPEHWFADLLHEVHLPHEALPSWLGQVDFRLVAVIAGLSIIVGDTLWRHHGHPGQDTAEAAVPPPPPATLAGPPLLDKPSIAVLPFANLSGDPEQEYFSDGVAEDIITEVSHNRSLYVIARNSSFTYKGHAVDVRQVARELGVRYVLEGSVRRDSGRLRITAQLIDAQTGNHLWADRFERPVQDLFALQDEIAIAVARAITPAVNDAELRRALRKPPESLDAWEAYQQGLWHLAKGNQADIERAQDLFRRATELDRMFAAPHAMLAFTLVNIVVFRDPQSVQQNIKAAEAEARRAIELDPDESSAFAVLSWVVFFDSHYDAALELAEHAILVNPNDVSAYLAKGRTLIFSGRPLEAQEPSLTAIRLSPRGPLSAFAVMQLASAHYLAGEYAEAASAAQRGVRDYPEFPVTYRWLAVSLGQLGRIEEAREILHRAVAIAPASFDYFVRSRPPWYRPEDHEHMLDGLRKAGWKE